MDSAFSSRPFPSYTTAQLVRIVESGMGSDQMRSEIERRTAVARGDLSKATAAERLRVARGKLT